MTAPSLADPRLAGGPWPAADSAAHSPPRQRPAREAQGHAGAANERRLEAHGNQQTLAAHVGGLALADGSIAEIATVVANELAKLYPGASASIGELLDAGRYRMLAASGWMGDFTGQVLTYESDAKAQGRHTLGSIQATVVADLQTESRFRPARMLTEHGVRSLVSAVLPGSRGPWGTIGLFAPEPGRFGPQDALFIESLALILAGAVGRRQVEADLDTRLRQQRAVALLGQEALRYELPDLLATAGRIVAHTLHADFCKIMELDREGRLLILRAGHGWRDGVVGSATTRADGESQAGFTMRSDTPVIVDDLQAETRFEPAPLLLEHGVVSGISVVIRGHDQPYGVLGAHSTHRRAFSRDDVSFLESVAALLGTAAERHNGQAELRRHRARLEEEVAERTRQLAASNKELEAFSYSVSHDLRAPLRTITGYSTLLSARHASTLGPESLQLLEAIHKNAVRLGHLIDDLLDLSRVQQVDLVRERVDLSALCTQAVGVLAATEPQRSVAVTIQPGMVAEGDARLLGMLVENLVGNAWKFTRRSEDAAILVSKYGSNGSTVYSVKDNGAGFDMAYAAKLFQPFHRLHRASEFEGTGVGLATVKRIIERHGGRLWAEGRVGGGATFYFTLGAARHA